MENNNELKIDYFKRYDLTELMAYSDEIILAEAIRICEDLELKFNKNWSKEEQCIFMIKVCDMNAYTETYIIPKPVYQKDEGIDEESVVNIENIDNMWHKSRKELRNICVERNIEVDASLKKSKLIKLLIESDPKIIEKECDKDD